MPLDRCGRRRRPHAALPAVRRGGDPAADRAGERRQPAAGPRDLAAAGSGGARGARRRPGADCAATAHRVSPAQPGRRRARHRPRHCADPRPAAAGRADHSAGSGSPRGHARDAVRAGRVADCGPALRHRSCAPGIGHGPGRAVARRPAGGRRPFPPGAATHARGCGDRAGADAVGRRRPPDPQSRPAATRRHRLRIQQPADIRAVAARRPLQGRERLADLLSAAAGAIAECARSGARGHGSQPAAGPGDRHRQLHRGRTALRCRRRGAGRDDDGRQRVVLQRTGYSAGSRTPVRRARSRRRRRSGHRQPHARGPLLSERRCSRPALPYWRARASQERLDARCRHRRRREVQRAGRAARSGVLSAVPAAAVVGPVRRGAHGGCRPPA